MDPDKPYIFVNPYPHIFFRQWDHVYPMRCPACGSSRYLGMRYWIDEKGTFALNPGSLPVSLRAYANPDCPILRYQRYVHLVCMKCSYAYHFRPEGLWYKDPHPPCSVAVYLLSRPLAPSKGATHYDYAPRVNQEYRFFVTVPLAQQSQHLDDDGMQISIVPAPHALMAGASDDLAMPIARLQDLKILKLATRRRYSTEELSPRITNSPVILLVGAGFSAPLGFPTMRAFYDQLDPWVFQTLGNWLGHKKELLDHARDDLEILLDLLLRLQRTAALSPSKDSFRGKLKDFANMETLFAFSEADPSARLFYPTLAQVRPCVTVERSINTDHFLMVRKMLYKVLRGIASMCHRLGDAELAKAKARYEPFLRELAAINGGPLPIYSTNYDRAVEQLLGPSSVVHGQLQEGTPHLAPLLSAGSGSSPRQVPIPSRRISPLSFCTGEDFDFAVFHLHGCSDWFVNADTGDVIEIDENAGLELATVFDSIWMTEDSWSPAVIAPATVKDSYTTSPPFNLGYDYLLENLLSASVAVIIGQQLRDETLKQMLLWIGHANPHLRLLVAGYGEMSKHVRDCLPEGRFEYFDEGFPDSATKIVSRLHAALHDRPPQLEILRVKAKILGSGGRLKEALAVYVDALELAPDDSRLLCAMGDILRLLGRFGEALDKYEGALSHSPNDGASLVGAGHTLRLLGRPNEALSRYQRAMQSRCMTTDLWADLSNIYAEQQDFAAVRECCLRILEIDDANVIALSNLGNALDELGLHEQALVPLKRVIDIDPRFQRALYVKGNALWKMGELEEAEAAFRQATELDREDFKAWGNLGSVLNELGRNEESVICHNRCIHLDPANVNAFGNRGNALAALGRIDEAVASFDRALKLGGPAVDVLLNKANALGHGMDRWDQALVCYANAVELDKGNDSAWICKGVAEAILSRFEEARMSFETAKKIGGAHAGMARENLEAINESQSDGPNRGRPAPWINRLWGAIRRMIGRE